MGKKAIVTGGTRGIGKSIARTLLLAGADVAICGRSQDSVDAAVADLSSSLHGEGGRVFGGVCDITNPSSVLKFFALTDDLLGSLDILVNNAGIGLFRPVAEMTEMDWQRVIDTNLSGVFRCCHAALERFRRNGKGFIVNISSLAGKNPFAGGAAYNASKFGLNGFGEAMMLDHRHENIRVCTIMPGSVATDFGGGRADWKIHPDDIAEVVRMVLSMPERTMVSAVEIRPSRPSK